jgi:hypothetical protein
LEFLFVKIILALRNLPDGDPGCLVVAPPRWGKLNDFTQKCSREGLRNPRTGRYYKKRPDELGVPLLVAIPIVTTSDIDGIHWEQTYTR